MTEDPIPYVGMYDIARASRFCLPQGRGNFRALEHLLSNFGFVRRDEVTAREFWSANALARLWYGSKFRAWRRNYFRLAAPYRALLRRNTQQPELTMIGWEMSIGMKRWLDAHDVGYIDVRLSPMRFYSDLLLDFSTNRATLDRLIGSRFVCVTRPELVQTAQTAAIDDSEADTLLVVGQVAGDSSLIGRDGRQLTLSDFRDRIAGLSAQYRRVLYRPHPKGAPAFDSIVRDLPRDPEPSIYTHMAKRASFCAISSSTLDEAAVFGCPTFRLAEQGGCERHGDRYVRRHVHVLRSAHQRDRLMAGGELPILRFLLGHNASDLGPLRAVRETASWNESDAAVAERRLRQVS